jgi:arginine decarboxylase
VPASGEHYGYLSELHGHGMGRKKAADLVEDMAASMLATIQGIEFDPDTAYDERKEIYRMSGKIIRSQAEVKVAEVNEDGQWTTVVAAAVFITPRE